MKFLLAPDFSSGKVSAVMAVVLFLLFAGEVLGDIFLLFSKRKNGGMAVSFSLGCLMPVVGIIIFGFLASVLIKPVFVYRYMVPAMPCMWLSLAVFLGNRSCGVEDFLTGWESKENGTGQKEKRKKAESAVVAAVLLLFVIIGGCDFRAFYGNEMWKQKQMKEAQEVLTKLSEEDAVTIFNFGQLQAVMAYYEGSDSYLWYERAEELVKELFPEVHDLAEGEFTDEAGISQLKELLKEGRRVYFLGSGKAREEIVAKWQEAGISVREDSSAMIERYWFNLYALTIDEEAKPR